MGQRPRLPGMLVEVVEWVRRWSRRYQRHRVGYFCRQSDVWRYKVKVMLEKNVGGVF